MPELMDEDQRDDPDRERRSKEQCVEPERDDHGDQGRPESAELDQNKPVFQEGQHRRDDAPCGAFAAAPLLARRSTGLCCCCVPGGWGGGGNHGALSPVVVTELSGNHWYMGGWSPLGGES